MTEEPKIEEVPDHSESDDSDDDMPELEAAAGPAGGDSEVPGEAAGGDASRSRSENKVRRLNESTALTPFGLYWSITSMDPCPGGLDCFQGGRETRCRMPKQHAMFALTKPE